jgi:hypothetical protein
MNAWLAALHAIGCWLDGSLKYGKYADKEGDERAALVSIGHAFGIVSWVGDQGPIWANGTWFGVLDEVPSVA